MFYAGYYDWKDHKEIKGKHEPMITWEQHQQIQDKLFNKNMPAITKQDAEEYILNFSISKGVGFTRCTECGGRLRTCKTRGNGGTYHIYYCKDSSCEAQKEIHPTTRARTAI